MRAVPSRTCLISLDGLLLADCDALARLMPFFAARVRSSSLSILDERVLTSAQAVWAEILTGKPWYTNGCVGYSRPDGSLNKLSVFSEKNLRVPLTLLESETDRLVSINVPLLRPTANRFWLSDGSLPIRKYVSPASLVDSSRVTNYVPRPLTNLAVFTESVEEIVRRCIEIESTRLDCAIDLFKQNQFVNFVYRVSAFDSLTHLIGLNFLAAKDLQIYDTLKQFLQRLDSFFELIADASVAVVSGYAHMPCRGVLNLNNWLESGGFFNLKTSSAAEARANAFATVVNARPPAHLMSSMEGEIDTATTTAASPISGAIFINKSDTFADGCVAPNDYVELRSRVKSLLEGFSRNFGDRFSMAENLSKQSHMNELGPEFMVHVRGFEFHNMKTGATVYNVPRTVHAPGGFALLPKEFGIHDSLKLTQLYEVLK